ncbi:hypothetical protein BDP55DRAFT_634319 [Colletotrichum godetiae]|uniref:Uncharacterized protein n=1 Tax=Colletotrichum godetiae TaxID=1209918 RepID=A0AAJ0AFR3_9PEZI|nr:uncharacterized protein BDP55DRAFT_634319 [Colletotrichum godetiae]KAK1673083.1 hypothetical protein BDP55DRAFT_634319 [Colletotrichum godetiae]
METLGPVGGKHLRQLLDDDLSKSEGSSSEGEKKDDDDDSGGGELSRCCDTDRPKRAYPLIIKASNAEYITVHDYVSVLHPWLMGLRQDIAQADNLMGERTPEESESLVVDITTLDYLRIMNEKRFLRSRYTGPPIPLPDMSQEYQDWPSKYVFREDVPFSTKRPPPPP